MTVKYKLNYIKETGECKNIVLNKLDSDKIRNENTNGFKLMSVSKYTDKLITNHIGLSHCKTIEEKIDKIQYLA